MFKNNTLYLYATNSPLRIHTQITKAKHYSITMTVDGYFKSIFATDAASPHNNHRHSTRKNYHPQISQAVWRVFGEFRKHRTLNFGAARPRMRQAAPGRGRFVVTASSTRKARAPRSYKTSDRWTGRGAERCRRGGPVTLVGHQGAKREWSRRFSRSNIGPRLNSYTRVSAVVIPNELDNVIIWWYLDMDVRTSGWTR